MKNASKDEQEFLFEFSLRKIVAGFLFVIAATSISLGTAFSIISPTTLFDPQQTTLLSEIKERVTTATTSNRVTIAAQQLTEATAELNNYVKVHPLVENSGEDFRKWYQQLLGVNQRLALAEQVEKSQASPLEKLQAEEIALKSVRDFAEIKLTNAFGANLGIDYNIPQSIPIQPNAVEQAIVDWGGLFFPVGIIAILFGLLTLVFSEDL